MLEQDVPPAHVTEARRFNRLLESHAEIDEVDQYLNMSLRLNAAAHNAERHEQLVVLKLTRLQV